jgi:hypothetical protein
MARISDPRLKIKSFFEVSSLWAQRNRHQRKEVLPFTWLVMVLVRAL